MKRLIGSMSVRSALCAAVFAGGCAVFAGCGDDGQTAGTEHDCADGRDDDGDGLTDCQDPDCAESADCLPCNHDGVCDPDEDSVRCPDDCPAPFCGDGSCNGNETLSTCPEDCAVCGDGYCDTPETRVNCPEDCAVCNDGFCDTGETRVDCPEDCAVCDDGICDPGETRVDCPDDCAVCGDGFCDTGETRVNCLQDCVACDDGFCDTPETRVDCPEDCAVCGDGFCDTGETKTNCPQDCIICGDGTCDAPETLGNCPMDCANILLRESFTTWVPAGWSALNWHQATQSGTTYAQSTGPDFAQDAILQSVTFSTTGYTNVGLAFTQLYSFGGTGVWTGVYVDAPPDYTNIDQPTDSPPGLVEYDISTEAANRASVKIDFAIGCANTSQCFGSDYWQITNVVVYAW